MAQDSNKSVRPPHDQIGFRSSHGLHTLDLPVVGCCTGTYIDLKGWLLVVKPGAAIYMDRFPPLELLVAIYYIDLVFYMYM